MEKQPLDSSPSGFTAVNRNRDVSNTVSGDLIVASSENSKEPFETNSNNAAVKQEKYSISEDEEDMITVYTDLTAENFIKSSGGIDSQPNTISFDDGRPDYSSTTSESEEETTTSTDARFFLGSDLTESGRGASLMASSVGTQSELSGMVTLNKTVYQPKVVDESFYPCVGCLSKHRPCDRRLPKCQTCSEASECIYIKKGVFSNQTAALHAWRAANSRNVSAKRESKSLPPSRTVEIVGSENPSNPDDEGASSGGALKRIIWLDGTLGPKKSCPGSIRRTIQKHLQEFEESVVSTAWGRTQKTCYMDRGRETIYVEEDTNQEVPVSRFLYGSKGQFFVAWVPQSQSVNVPTPVICRFKVYNSGLPAVTRNNKVYRRVDWKSWKPKSVHRKVYNLHRLIEDVPYGLNVAVPNADNTDAAEIVDLDVTENSEESSTADRPGSKQNGYSTASEADAEELRANNSKSARRKRSIEQSTHAEEQHHFKRQNIDGKIHSTKIPPNAREKTAMNPHSTRSAKRRESGGSPQMQLNKQEKSSRGAEISCIFKDKAGEVRGMFDYDECNTAQRLFDVACVAQIAQLEPPATRLLKLTIQNGTDNLVSIIIRPDNEHDFEKLEIQLKRLRERDKSIRTLNILVNPYL